MQLNKGEHPMTKKTYFYIECPYSEKDKCKQLGGYWDTTARKWYVPEGIDREPFREWFPEDMPLEKKSLENSISM